MDELIRVSREILENFDLYGQPIPPRLLAELRQAVEAAQHSVHPTDGILCKDCGHPIEISQVAGCLNHPVSG